MRTDVVHLRESYRSPLGQLAKQRLREKVTAVWPNLNGLRVAGVGYPAPVLRPMLDEAASVLALMPAGQGVHRWPADQANHAVQVEEVDWPVGDAMVDRLILMHALETTEEIRPFLRECWRILAPGGRMLVIVPNRRGMWALRDHIPFGHGRPYTARQLRRAMQDNLFETLSADHALHLPPVIGSPLLRLLAPVEPVAGRWFARFGGAVVLEAEKRVGGMVPVAARVRRYLPETAVRPVANMSESRTPSCSRSPATRS